MAYIYKITNDINDKVYIGKTYFEIEKRFQELELQMQENGFWDDVKRAEEVTKECKAIKDKIERYDNLVNRIDDIEVLAELAEEDEETAENEE